MTPKQERRLHWPNTLFLTLSPLVALVSSIYYTHHYGMRGYEMALFVVMFFATGLSITAGYHRHFAHLSYKASSLVKIFYLIFGACAVENSALNWSADHRMHHRYTDTDLDPYNAARGFWSSHIGWIFYHDTDNKKFDNVGDLMRDKWVMWQHKYHWQIALIVGLGIPTLIGAMFGRPFGGMIWGGFVRVVFVHHMTFFINSLAHMYGSQEYSRADTSRDSWWLAFLTHGEGYHNFHHRFPSDYRNGIKWYQWDPTKWFIAGLNVFQLTNRLHRIPPHLILRARMEVDALEAEKHLQRVAPEHGTRLRVHLDAARVRMEHALAQWGQAKIRLREMKQAAWKDSEPTRQQWKLKLQEYEARLEEARDTWRTQLQELFKTPAVDL
jgi:stearoyl-CoA desaturase (delta-9 desaturase)